jgi:hypothetical protein
LCRSHVNRVPANSPFYTFSAQCCLLSRNEGCFTAIALAFAMLEERDEVRNSLARRVGRRAREGPKQLLLLAADNYSE